MDAKKIKQIREHIAGDSGQVAIVAADYCQLINESRTRDEELKRTATALAGHVGFVEVPIERVTKLLDAVDKAAAGGTAGVTNKRKGKDAGDA